MDQVLVYVQEKFASFAQLLDEVAVLLVFRICDRAFFELVDLDFLSFARRNVVRAY